MNKALFLTLIVAGVTATAWAEDPLDRTLGPKAPDAVANPAKTDPKSTPAADPKAAPANNDPKAGDPKGPGDGMVSPDAANTVDSEDLIKKLTGREKDSAGPDKMLDEVLERMGDTAKRLHDQDPGPVTQEIERRIVTNLDTLIELARQQQNQSQSQSQSQSKGEQRQRNPGQQSQPGKQPGQGQGGTTAAQSSQLPGAASNTGQLGPDNRERGKEWGNLPDRDRDMIAKYANEKTVPTYEEAVRRYYEALAEVSRNRLE